MTMFLIQSAILIAIAFIVGCIIGCLLKRMFAGEDVSVRDAAVPLAAAGAAATAAAAIPSAPAQTTAAPTTTAAPVPAHSPVAPAVPLMAASAAMKPKLAAKPKPAPKPKAAPVAKVASAPKAAAAPKAKPVVKPATKPKVAAIPAKPDDLKLIVGIGPVNERKLNAHGVSTFAQIAGWKKPDIVEVEKYLAFDGRIEREEWVRQAKKLAAGGKSEDEAELARRGGKTTSNSPAKPAAPKAAGIMGSAAVKTAKAPAAKSAAKPVAVAKPVTKTATKPAPSKAIAKPAPTKPAAAAKPAAPAKKPMAVKLAKPVGGKPDNLTLINGIGNVIEKKLHSMGVFHFEQIANWTKAQAEDASKAVGFPGRAEREGWMKEAAIFMKGGTTAHAKKVEKGEIPTSRKSTAAEKGKKK